MTVYLCEDLTISRRPRPNGIGINYAARSAQSLTPSLHPGDPDSGYSSVTNTDSKSPSLAKCTPEPHDLPSSLPPRHRHPKNRQLHSKDGRHEDMLVEEQTVTLHHLLPEITAMASERSSMT